MYVRWIKELNEKIDGLSKENSRLLKEIKTLEETNHSIKTDVNELGEENTQLRSRISDIESEVESKNPIISQLEEEKRRLENKTSSMKGEIDGLNSEIERLKDTKDLLQKHKDYLQEHHSALKERWEKVRIPSILFTTMPKSGTYYISNLLAKGLNADTIIVANQYFPYDTIRYHQMKEFSQGNYVSQDHFPPAEINLHHISSFADRLICHLRDPRQAMLSYLHYVESFRYGEDTYLLIYPKLPVNYYEFTFEEKIDWGIQHWLPLLIEWTEAWVKEADQNNQVRIIFMHFENFLADQDHFVYSILDYYGIPRERYIPPQLEKTSDLHFRKGAIDEWRKTMTENQRKRATEMIPESLAERMEWDLST